ncbi:MAG: PilT protein N-terminal [Rhodospirillales bacterium]|nr:PilT protein N-terminal [Rhodospirillales bacterium]
MTKLVVDASVVVKWVVPEIGSQDAARLLKAAPLAAPELLIAECANILWKKVQRKELMPDEALMAARLIERADIELCPTRHLLEVATKIAIELDHPAYDCIYLSLADLNDWHFVTADQRLLQKLAQPKSSAYSVRIMSIVGAVEHYLDRA